MKILCNVCLHFARQNGKTDKKRKENHATKETKIPKTRKFRNCETAGSLKIRFQKGFEPIAFALQWT